MIFDAHTHLNFEKFTDEERTQLAQEIEASELGYIIDVADCVSSAEQALRDADEYDWCYAAVGIHPDHASVFTDADIELIHQDYIKARRAWIAEIRKDAEKEYAMGDVDTEVFDDFISKLDHEIDYED